MGAGPAPEDELLVPAAASPPLLEPPFDPLPEASLSIATGLPELDIEAPELVPELEPVPELAVDDPLDPDAPPLPLELSLERGSFDGEDPLQAAAASAVPRRLA